ncbi:DnaJ C-terminal domain-containing protein [Variovorax sp. Sphag1AA]|uniref:DnaJ C-terminal domain-containing protein n=1 Tax=Variovorax sp. Sphag1AA TaxID=2587027 RepID=UPI00161E6F3E|nr:DnaJ C-terminal domain-containing protein [Variovorax sp. Sphag1AA]MBB3179949.1 molecular chaperone DnaJ [Variovorax sp. Sphag1AA]
MTNDNAFSELGLGSDATEREVKAAWRRLVSQWHPDRNSSADAVARMQRINRAFEEIRNAGFRASPEVADPPVDEPAETQAEEEPTEPRRRPIQRKVKLTLEEAASGCIKALRGRTTLTCATCDGAGHQVLGGNCTHCGGSGAIAKRNFFGWPGGMTECAACHGGGIAQRTCPDCQGAGTQVRAYQLKVRIPPGVRQGDLLHVDGRRARGNPPPADLEIRVELLAHEFFELDEDGTIRCEVPVDGFAWIANRTIDVPTLMGLKQVALRRDRLSYSLPGLGFPAKRRGANADHIVIVKPVFPEALTAEQEHLLSHLIASASGEGGEPTDKRLRAWSRKQRAWARGAGRASKEQ